MHPDYSPGTLAQAVLDKRFVFHYQPIISLVTGRICGAEALIRWKKRDGTLIQPSEFIPAAEDDGMITEITLEAISAVFRDLPVIDKIDDSVWLSFNASAKDFADRRIVDFIAGKLEHFGLRPDRVRLEITETAFLPLTPVTRQGIQAIAGMGLKFCLDDFSAGHSTFEYLSQLPLSSLKIALPLTQRAATSRIDWRLFRHLVSLGDQLRYEVIAEGVENDELHNLILSTGCTSVQGYYYSHPLPLEAFIALLRQARNWVSFPYGLMYLAQIDHIDFRRDVIREAMNILADADADKRARARTRLPDFGFSENLFHEWILKKEAGSTGLTPEQRAYESNYMKFRTSCTELLELAERRVPWNVFESKYREIIDNSSSLMASLTTLSSESMVRAFKLERR